MSCVPAIMVFVDVVIDGYIAHGRFEHWHYKESFKNIGKKYLTLQIDF